MASASTGATSSIGIIIPTYNEKDNILELLKAILASYPKIEILVVDDGSPDGTASLVKEFCLHEKRVHLLERTKKEGLGPAYVAGFKWGLNHGFQFLIQMDADFSHRVKDIEKLLSKSAQYDFVIGSRWIRGGEIVNWSYFRRLLSLFGNLYAQIVLGGNFRDWTGGFNLWRREILEKCDLDSLEAQGYVFQVEMKFRAFRLNFVGIEVPIIFEERRHGQSKMSSDIILEAFLRIWRLRSKFSSSFYLSR